MFEHIEQSLLNFLLFFAYDPITFYSLIVLIMALATFGLPVSEEVVIVSAGLAVYMGAHPELYPPPVSAVGPALSPVQPLTTALVCFLSVFLTDLMVYMMGFVFRGKIINHPLIKKRILQKRKEKIDLWITKYGYFVSGFFRFTPGLRFIGYLTCGVVRIPILKFILFNGGVALLVVPSQVLLVSHYGEAIMENLKTATLILAVLFAVFLLTVIVPPVYRLLKQDIE